MGTHLVDAAADGRAVWSLATTRKRNRLDRFDGSGWSAAAEWDGPEASALAVCGGAIVVGGLDGAVWVWREGALHTLNRGHKEFWPAGAAAIDGRTVLLGGLMGGTGGLFELDVASGELTQRKLGELGVSRPGRSIWNIVRAGDRVLILGERNLLVEYRRTGASELLPSARELGRELFLQDAAEWRGELWVSGTEGGPLLARLDGRTPERVETPLGARTAPTLLSLGEELAVGGDGLVVGAPGAWREVVARGGKQSVRPVAAVEGGFLAVTSGGGSLVVARDGRVREGRVW